MVKQLFQMKRRLFTRIFILILILVQLGCSNKTKPDEIHIKIIESTDVHGAIFPYDFLTGQDISSSLAQFHTFVLDERRNANQEVILLDNGDILQGQPPVYFSNFLDTTAIHICAKTMNFMGYDAATAGNHDIEAGHDVYDKLVREFKFPWMAANAIEISTGKPYFIPYTVIDKKGIKIAVLGLITPGIPKWLPPGLYKGLFFEDMVKSAEYWMAEINESVKPDLVIGLFHAGYDYSYGGSSKDDPGNENGSLLVAEKVPGFDIIFIGHDHKFLLDSIINVAGETVYIVDPGSYARNAGVADIRLTRNKKEKKYDKMVSLDLVNISEYMPDPEFLEYLDHDLQQTKKFVEGKIATLTENIVSHEALFGSSAFTDLIHRVQLDLTGADISFTAPLSFNSTLLKGELTVADLFKLYRYENFLYTMSLKGKEIKDYLEYSYGQWFNHMKNRSDHLLKFELNDQGELKLSGTRNSARLLNMYYNFDSAVGIKYTVDVSKPSGERVTITSMADGSLFDENRDYRVALNSYRGSGGGGHLTTGAGIKMESLTDRIEFATTKDLRYHMMEWMIEKKNIEPVKYDNWTIIPEAWYNESKKRDKKLLFPDIY